MLYIKCNIKLLTYKVAKTHQAQASYAGARDSFKFIPVECKKNPKKTTIQLFTHSKMALLQVRAQQLNPGGRSKSVSFHPK